MYPSIAFINYMLQCPYCAHETNTPEKMELHLNNMHSMHGKYEFIMITEQNRKRRFPFAVRGPCLCGCEEVLTYAGKYVPDHEPPFYASGHTSKNQIYNPGRFKPNNKPWNLGTKGLCQGNKGSFKKGHVPKSDRGGIHILKEGYVYIWLGDYQPSGPRKYVGRARLVMEHELGRPLTSNEIVIHLDGDPSNDDPDNLEVITRRENRKRNRHGHTRSKVGICKRCNSVMMLDDNDEYQCFNCYSKTELTA